MTLTVTATNAADVAEDIVITTGYGSKSFTGVAPGKSVSAAFSTRATSIPADNASVRATATAGAKPVTVSADAPYAGRSRG